MNALQVPSIIEVHDLGTFIRWLYSLECLNCSIATEYLSSHDWNYSLYKLYWLNLVKEVSLSV